MNTKRQYKSYSKEFKEEALPLISEQGYSVQEAASALGVTTSLLYSWKQKHEEQENSTVSLDEKAEILVRVDFNLDGQLSSVRVQDIEEFEFK